jgi:predicted AAA+ superfamily ATPase
VFPHLGYANLEAPDVRAFAAADPRGFLSQFPDGAVLDELQRVPDLPSYLQGMIDQDPRPGRWILTGSQNLALLSSVSQSLAGRSAVLHLLPMAYSEITRFPTFPTTPEQAMLSGGYPPIHDRSIPPTDWLGSYVATYIERDVRSVSNIGDLITFQRFVELCAGRTAQVINYSTLAADAGITQPTAKAWLSVLEASFLVYRVPPYHANTRKRVTKSPRMHFHDTGLACWLLGIRTPEQLRSHPLRGPLFETWVASEILKHRMNRAEPTGLSFYRDASGIEVDLIVQRTGSAAVVEVKSASTAPHRLFDGLRRAAGAGPEGSEPILVYAGPELQRRTEGLLLPWNRLHEIEWT